MWYDAGMGGARGIVVGIVVAVAGCGGGHADPDRHAVGTYVGGGSYLTGADPCTYAATAGVFAPGDDGHRGPVFVIGAGTITRTCGDVHTSIVAIAPTGVRIDGPAHVRRGATSEAFAARLVAGDATLDGDAALDWQLGPDCAGRATFAPVLGAQDTGGRDRTRALVATAPGACTLTVVATTGSSLAPTFAAATFRAARAITID